MKKNRWTTAALLLVMLVGLSLLLYPRFSDFWNASRQTKAINDYAAEVAVLSEEDKLAIWQAAVIFNGRLRERTNPYALPESLRRQYETTLDVSGNGVIAYVDIPSINVLLPIFHGTSENVLQRGIGHIEWSYLPVGGESTHCVISGHRSLPSSRLFSDLGKMMEGDIFMLQVLDRTLTYEVDQILIVEPEDVLPLAMVPGEDYCTLVTCTPYGVNTHRMLVRGHRIPNVEDANLAQVVSEAMRIEPTVVAGFLAVPMVLLLLLGVGIRDLYRKRNAQSR